MDKVQLHPYPKCKRKGLAPMLHAAKISLRAGLSPTTTIEDAGRREAEGQEATPLPKYHSLKLSKAIMEQEMHNYAI
ncbi:hypothetical protein AAP_01529 [Ascosphaera apis ARSEF 7405]|uniref:Uncharacterized protein n=1 Tax=Ascosphaera apis ARSEF 7405 TaxID=392613 RepID=A0A168BAQ6_9EURO|nr:hypothetical protein AAP_01529 [Ascosphaera apis ARSEF 7405]